MGKEFKQAIVFWNDITSYEKADNLEETVSFEAVQFKTIGFVISSSKKEIRLAMNQLDDGCLEHIYIIPRGCIIKIEYLKVA